jgi:hypothetical protein
MWANRAKGSARPSSTTRSRIVRASEEIAVRAVVLHAIDENVSAFYERFGFRALSATPRTLIIALAALRDADYA